MPRDLKGKELLARHTTNADRTVLREFADLAERLGFQSPEITALKEHPGARDSRNPSENSKPLLVTDGVGVKKKRRCGLPSMEEYVEGSESIFVNYLHDVDEEQGEGITSFFVRNSIYFAFFGKPSPLPWEGLHPRNNAVEGEQELERQELERQELERREQEGRELEKQQQEKRDQEEKPRRQEARRQHARKDHQGRLQRLKQKKLNPNRPQEEGEELRGWERSQNSSLEDARRLDDQQRIEQYELLDQEIDEDIDLAPGEVFGNTMVRINFKVRDGGTWKHASAHTIGRSDPSEIEKVATNCVREKLRLFTTELRMLAPHQCCEAVIADGTYMILLMRESEIDIDYDIMLSAMKIGAEAKEAVFKSSRG